MIQDFHDGVDLLALLDIVDSPNDMFAMDKQTQPSQKSILPPKKKPFEPIVDTIAVDVPTTVTINVQTTSTTSKDSASNIVVDTLSKLRQTAPEQTPEETLNVQFNVKHEGTSSSDSKKTIENKFEQLVKVSGGSNIDVTVEKILAGLKELSGNLFKNAEVQKAKTESSTQGEKSSKLHSYEAFLKQSAEAPKVQEETVCRPEDKDREEQKFHGSSPTRSDLEKQSYIQRLFTCPAQPFHFRLSLMGEMFVGN